MGISSKPQKLQQIKPEDVLPNPDNPRMIFRREELESLLFSIGSHGIKVPIAVYKDGKSFRLIDGERRWRCAIKLNLATIPALVQEKPSPLENLLLMYNIHALREQWDYFTIASNLQKIIILFEKENDHKPNETELSEATGLTRGQIRRCQLIMGLPEKYQKILLEELKLPKSNQRVSEDFFLEMERSLKTVITRLPEFEKQKDKIRDTLIKKYRKKVISAVTDFRYLSKIATGIKNLGISEKKAKRKIEKIFDIEQKYGIREAFKETVEFGYDEKNALKQITSLNEFLEEIHTDEQQSKLDQEFLDELKKLSSLLKKVLGS